MLNSTVEISSSQMNFTLDLIDNTDVFKASIVAGQLHPVSTSTVDSVHSSSPGSHVQGLTQTTSFKSAPEHTVENLNEQERALDLMFPTILVPGGGHKASTRLHILRGLREDVMGRVFLARDPSTSKVFALKAFSKRNVLENEQLETTVAERDFLSETRDNPFVIDLQASLQDEARLYMLLNFCAGGNLAMQLSRWSGKMPIDTAVYIAAHLVEGIASLHALGIVHRDLKPENVLLTVHGHIKISDFSSAAHIDSPEQWIEPTNEDNFGTAAYLAPEIIAGDLYNSAIDWWTLGIMIYEMVVGQHPFVPGSVDDEDTLVDIEDMQESICDGEYTLPQSMDSPTRRIIRGFLRTNPERRYTATEARKSEFFDGWDWDLVRALRYQAPTPHIVHNLYDSASNFDSGFNTMNLDVDDNHSNDLCDPLLFRGFEPVPNVDSEKPFGSFEQQAVTKLPDLSQHHEDTGDKLHDRISKLSTAFATELSIVHGSRGHK